MMILSKLRRWLVEYDEYLEIILIVLVVIGSLIWVYHKPIVVESDRTAIICIDGTQYIKFREGIVLKFDSSGQTMKCTNK